MRLHSCDEQSESSVSLPLSFPHFAHIVQRVVFSPFSCVLYILTSPFSLLDAYIKFHGQANKKKKQKKSISISLSPEIRGVTRFAHSRTGIEAFRLMHACVFIVNRRVSSLRPTTRISVARTSRVYNVRTLTAFFHTYVLYILFSLSLRKCLRMCVCECSCNPHRLIRFNWARSIVFPVGAFVLNSEPSTVYSLLTRRRRCLLPRAETTGAGRLGGFIKETVEWATIISLSELNAN